MMSILEEVLFRGGCLFTAIASSLLCAGIDFTLFTSCPLETRESQPFELAPMTQSVFRRLVTTPNPNEIVCAATSVP